MNRKGFDHFGEDSLIESDYYHVCNQTSVDRLWLAASTKYYDKIEQINKSAIDQQTELLLEVEKSKTVKRL